MNPKISVIVPVYKVEKYIDECIGSIRSQTYSNLEIILVDDGSPDKCPQICDMYASVDNRIRVIHKSNGGLSDARNTGIKQAKGEYIIFIDSDDFWIDVAAIEKLVAILNDDNDCDLIFFGRTSFLNGRAFPGPSIPSKQINGAAKYDALMALLKDAAFVGSACQKLIRRTLITDNELYFKKGLLSEDWDWSMSLYMKAKRFGALPENFYGYRKREGSITETFSLKHTNDMLYIIEKWSHLLSESKDMVPFKGFLAYCLCCTLGSIELLPAKERKVRDSFRPYIYLLNYNYNNRVKTVSKLIRYVGFYYTCKLLGFYLKFRPKRLK